MNRAAPSLAPDDGQEQGLSCRSVQLAVCEAMALQLPEVNQLLESSFSQLSSEFMELMEDVESLKDSLKSEADSGVTRRISGRLAQAMIAMQFQDRVSQNLVIAIHIFQAMASQLRQELSENPEERTVDKAVAEAMISVMKLGEVREKFVNSLLKHNLIEMVSEIGLSEQPQVSHQEDDIELF